MIENSSLLWYNAAQRRIIWCRIGTQDKLWDPNALWQTKPWLYSGMFNCVYNFDSAHSTHCDKQLSFSNQNPCVLAFEWDDSVNLPVWTWKNIYITKRVAMKHHLQMGSCLHVQTKWDKQKQITCMAQQNTGWVWKELYDYEQVICACADQV